MFCFAQSPGVIVTKNHVHTDCCNEAAFAKRNLDQKEPRVQKAKFYKKGPP